MPKKLHGPGIDRELEDVLSRAQTLHPRLLARRAEIAAELERVDAALARLRSLEGKLGAATEASVTEVLPAAKARRGSNSPTAKKLEQPVLAALARFTTAVGSAEITKALQANGLAVRSYPLQVALKKLRDQGHVRASGKARRFSYELAGRSRA